MTRPHRKLAGAVMAAFASMAMAPVPPVNVDLITVSGRYGLPRGDGSPIAARLALKDAAIDSTVSTTLALDAELLRAALRQGVEKSLRNHGYIAAADAPTSTPIRIRMAALDVQADEAGSSVTVEIATIVDETAPTIACLPYTATGKFRALAPIKSGGGQRATGIIFGALLGPVGGTFMANQLQNASADNRAMNARRTVAEGEGVSPAFGRAAVTRHAAVNATQMAIVDLLRHLGTADGCKAPAPPVETPQPLASN